MGFLTFLLKNLFRRKTRSLLTGVAVAVAVGTTVALLGVADGFRRSNEAAYSTRGIDLIVMEANKPLQINSELEEKTGERIARIPGVRDVTPGLVDTGSCRKGKNEISVLVH